MCLTWRRKPDGNYNLTRFCTGEVVVTNCDTQARTDQEHFELDEKVKRYPAALLWVNMHPRDPGVDFPIQGAIKLRNMNEMINLYQLNRRSYNEAQDGNSR